MRLGLFGDTDDPLTLHIEGRARVRGHAVVRIPLTGLCADLHAAFDGSAWFLAGERVDDCDAYVLRRFPSAHSPGRGLQPGSTGIDFDRWWSASLEMQEIASFAESCIMAVEVAGKPVLNPWLACAPFDHKPLQLAVFRAAGLPIPATLVTNAAPAVAAFAAHAGELIAKPTKGGAETRRVDQAFLDAFAAHARAPVIFQQRIIGTDVRVTLVGDRIVSAVEIPTEALDYRSGTAYREGRQVYREHTLSAEGEAICRRAAALCHQVLSGVDLKVTAEGDYALIEANSAPVYLGIEQATGAPVTDAVLEYLEARA